MALLSEGQKDKLDKILAEAVESKSTPALFFGVTNVDGEIYMRQAGTKLVDDPSSESINEDTVFWMCSQTKLITTIAALQLIEQGRIALDTHVDQLLPELANPVIICGRDGAGNLITTPAKSKITFGQLLNHTSGLDYYADGTIPASGMPLAYSHSYKGEDTSAFFKIIKGSFPGVPLKFEPGTDFGYGFSSDCVGFIVEKISGKSLEDYFQEYIFAPLGVTSPSFYLTPSLKDRLLPLSFRNANGTIERLNDPAFIDQDSAHIRVHLGGVGLYSSQKDYLTILRHLLQIKGHTSPAGAETMNAAAAVLSKYLGLPAGAAQFSRGLLVNTADVPGKRRKNSGAWGGWANTSYFIDPTTGVAAVFGTQLVPTDDDKHEQVYALLEQELYAGLKA
ncbi:beta-lactamase/transpeptidase-like protein [Mycena vulgaris]|nr:beta-lactamase/transpeptidase-like protein [Mycena vulgaris]